MLRSLLALALAGALSAASATEPYAPPGTPDNTGNIPDTPEWKEIAAPPPPPLRTSGLLPMDVTGTTMRFGIDPASVQVGRDGVVRYVVVATSPSGVVNAMYEGINCSASQVKVYAYHNPDSGWQPATQPKWQPLRGNPPMRHSLSLAQSGVCLGDAPNGSAAQIVQDLRSPVERRFGRGGTNR
ncbi:MAG: CNP1-like family protein [Burkholderiales bacterium]|nr:CNP1-like family protein [Burkholderiales bacterium]